MDGLQRGSAAIVGVAESDLGAVAPETSPIDLMAQGIRRALDDCGLQLKDVDGLLCATAQSRTSGLNLAEYLGISPAFVDTTILGGSSFMFHVAHAQAALQLGLCQVAVIAYGSTQRTIGRHHASVREYNPYETPFRPFLPSTAYALAASRHMHQYGTTREQLAAVAVAAREWALLNPVAWEKKPLTIADVLSARMISYPFTVRDICLVTDGGGAVVMTTAERARSLRKPPAYVLGAGQAITHANISSMPDLTVTGAVASGRAAYDMAKLGPADIDVLELYDAFTINPILFLEDLGFCPKGEGGSLVEGGHIAPGGPLPVNTNGGGLSYCHPGMYGLFLLIEATRQLRGECGARQIADCETAIAHGNGGVLSSQSTVILGDASYGLNNEAMTQREVDTLTTHVKIEMTNIMGTAWKNSSGFPSGNGGYGIKIDDLRDRQKYFASGRILLHLDGSSSIFVNTDKKSFWTETYGELISKEIGNWMRSKGLIPWPDGHPPKFSLEPVSSSEFKVRLVRRS